MITAIVLLIAQAFAIFLIRKRVQFSKISQAFWYVHLICLSLVILDIILLIKIDWSFRGPYTDRVVTTLWFVSGICLFAYYFRQKKHKILRAYLAVYFFMIPFLLVIWLVPIIGFVPAFLGASLIIDGDIQRFPLVQNIQLQQEQVGIMGQSMYMEIIESKGLFEKKYKQTIYKPSSGVRSVKTQLISNTRLRIFVLANDTSRVPIDTIITLGNYVSPYSKSK